MSVGISILVTAVLVLVNGYFSMSEMALVNVRKSTLEREAEEGDRRALKAFTLASDSDQLLATIQVAITLVGFFASAAAATTLSEPFAAWMSSFGIGWITSISAPLATILITLIVSYFSIVVGELVPKRIALANANGVSKAVSGSLLFFQRISKPLVVLTSASSSGLARLLNIKSADDRQSVSEEDIKDIVTGNDELLDDEKRMIHEIIDLGDTTAHEIMTPRTDMMLIEDSDTVKQALDRMRGTGYSRLPVFHEDYDRIIGVVNYKNLVPALMDDREDSPVGEFVQPAFFVPETKDIFPLLSEMQTNRQQMAIVVDEYGGTDGLITIEDIVEEIVGDIIDESDLESKYITCLSDDEWLADGSFPVEDAIELGWPVTESEEYETVAGWLIDTVDTIPQMGEEFTIDGFSFKVQNMRRHRISVLRVKRLEVQKEPEQDDDGNKREDTLS